MALKPDLDRDHSEQEMQPPDLELIAIQKDTEIRLGEPPARLVRATFLKLRVYFK